MDNWFEADRAIGLALAPSIHKLYTRAGRKFNTFRHREGLQDVRSTPVPQLMQFCVFLRGKGLSVDSIRDKLAALAFASKGMGSSDNTDYFCLWKVLER